MPSPQTSSDRASPTPATAVDPQQAAEREAWRAEQDARMRSELSPLARVDYIHLPAGESAVRTDKGAPVYIAADTLAPYVGDIRFRVQKSAPAAADAPYDVAVTAQPAVRVDGVATTQAALQKGQVIAIGLARLLLTGDASDPALAVYDLGAPPRRAYAGLHYYPDDDRYSVWARFEPYAQPVTVRLAASRGDDKPMQAVGSLHFTLPGPAGDHAASLEAYLEEPGGSTLFLIFRDQTSGQPGGSYGAGRFLYARLQAGKPVRLDFNRAWNPLCAYSPYFHCPLPPRKNWISAAIPVGEKVYSEH